MIDIAKIGQRIKEQRKYIARVSQEKMAEDLNMYQADISNMEKAKSGSGITDLLKLDLIAEYFDIPLETLLFGREDNRMVIYHGDKMTLKESKKKMPKSHRNILLKLTGRKEEEEFRPTQHECGPYMIYSMVEQQFSLGNRTTFADGKIENPEFVLPKLHTFVFLGFELVGVMVADMTYVMQHVFQPALQKLQMMIQPDVLDVTDVWRTLNPYWPLWQFAQSAKEAAEYEPLMVKRMDSIRSTGENRPVLYIENVYVREDCRKHGIFRMYIDLLKMLFNGCIMWLNMEPTSGNELDNEYDYVPSYSVSELGQLNINAAIAEKVGFTVDPDTWHRQAETVDPDGNISVETVLIRKCAYCLPAEIRTLLMNDGDLVAQGRAKQRIYHSQNNDSAGGIVDINHGYRGDDVVSEVRSAYPSGRVYYASAIASKDGSVRYVLSFNSLLRAKDERIIEEYATLEDAMQSEHSDLLGMANSLLMIGRPAPMQDDFASDEETFDIIDDISCTITDDTDTVAAEILEVQLRRTNTENAGETLYAFVMVDVDEGSYYALNKNSIRDCNDDLEAGMQNLEAIVEFNGDEELAGSKYCYLFHTIKSHM